MANIQIMELGLNYISSFGVLQYLVLFTSLICFIKILFAPKKIIRRPPPSPPRLPIIGNFHQITMGTSPLAHRALQSLSQKYGPLMMVSFGSKPVLVASTVEAAREISKNHDLVFSGRPKSRIIEKLLHGAPDVAFAPYGEYWRELKSFCVLRLLSNNKVRSFRGIREEETTRIMEKIRQKTSSTSSSSSVINLSEMLVTVMNDIIARIILGRRYSCDDNNNNGNNTNTNNKIVRMIKGFAEVAGTANITDYIPWLGWINNFNGHNAKAERVSKEIDEVMDEIIAEHKIKMKEEDDDTSDFVDILLDVQRKNLTTFPLEIDTIKAVLIDMIGAGTDTTYTLMDWSMAELLRHPKILEKLQTEIRQAVADQGKIQVTEDDLPRMIYLKAVIKEVLRLHPPLPLLLPHESTQDDEVMGYDVSAGTQALINVWAIGRDPNIWEEPEEFRPDRFLDSNIDYRGLHFELIPFGAGRRGCPGISFSAAVSELALARFLYSFNFSLPIGVKLEEMDMTENNGINGKRKLPLLVNVSSYSS